MVLFYLFHFISFQNVLVPVSRPRPAPSVTGRDPVQTPTGQPERRKQPADQEQLLLLIQERPEDFIVQNQSVFSVPYRPQHCNDRQAPLSVELGHNTSVCFI